MCFTCIEILVCPHSKKNSKEKLQWIINPATLWVYSVCGRRRTFTLYLWVSFNLDCLTCIIELSTALYVIWFINNQVFLVLFFNSSGFPRFICLAQIQGLWDNNIIIKITCLMLLCCLCRPRLNADYALEFVVLKKKNHNDPALILLWLKRVSK